MKSAALCVCLLLGTVCSAAPESDANSGRATVVFLRLGEAGRKPATVGVALISPEGPRTIATLDSNEKATVTMPAGRQGFVLYSLQPDAPREPESGEIVGARKWVDAVVKAIQIQLDRKEL